MPEKSKQGARNRIKGQIAEREVATLLRAHGFEARRGRQYKGTDDSPDVTHNMPGFHIEVKNVRSPMFHPWLERCAMEAGEGKSPLLFWRRDRIPWYVVIRADDFLRLANRAADNAFAAALQGAEENEDE